MYAGVEIENGSTVTWDFSEGVPPLRISVYSEGKTGEEYDAQYTVTITQQI